MNHKYLLVTPACNEEQYIEKTIESVVSQEKLPQKWIIVDDGSTDNTANIVKKYTTKYGFIKLLSTQNEQRNFNSKAIAVNTGYKQIKHIEHEFVGNLDADITFHPDYYVSILKYLQLDCNKNVGICGGNELELYKGTFKQIRTNTNSVPGPIQFFRRKCFSDIGGYYPSKEGLIDAIAEVKARMLGWETKCFQDLKVYHHRRTGSVGNNVISGCLRSGRLDYLLGLHPFFHILKSLKRTKTTPFLFAFPLNLFGYFSNYLKKTERPVNDDFVGFLRNEERQRIKEYLSGNFKSRVLNKRLKK